MASTYQSQTLAIIKAESGDYFIILAPNRWSQLPLWSMDNFTSMLYPEFEPGTLGVAVGSPSYYAAWSAGWYKYCLETTRKPGKVSFELNSNEKTQINAHTYELLYEEVTPI